MTYDVIIRDGLWFDGTGSAPQTRTLGIRDGVVADIVSEAAAGHLDETGCPEVIDAKGKWVVPGFVDVHTHYDAEVLLDPGLQRVGASRCHHGVAGHVLAVDGLRQRRRRRRPVQPRRGGAAQVRPGRAAVQQDLVDGRGIR